MNFKLPFLQKKQKEREFFLALIIKPHKVRVILFESIDNNLVILAAHEEDSPRDVESLDIEELIALSDKAISSVESSLPPGAQVSKTIFAVPYAWVEEGKIKKDYLLTLKKVCEELALTPIGFIISVEAIIGHLQKKQGAPLTSLFVELTPHEELSLFVVKLGNIIEYKKGKKEENVVKSVEDLLKQVETVDVLPSQLVIFNYPDSAALQQKFLSHQWSKDIPFLHLPQVTVLEKGFEDEALVNGVANQMGVTVGEGNEEAVGKEYVNEEKTSNAAVVPSEEFGFVKEKDIKEEVVEPVKDEKVESETESNEPVIKYAQKEAEHTETVSEELPIHHKDHENVVPVSPSHISHHATSEHVHEGHSKKTGTSPALLAEFMKIIHHGIKLPHTIMKRIPVGKSSLLIPLGAILLIVVGFIYLYLNFIEKAEIQIQIDKKTFSKDQSVTFSPKDSPSFANNVLSLKTLDEDVTGDKTTDTSGKQDTGDKAKGEVTIYNKTEQKKTFSKGTVLTGPNSLKFATLDEVSVASTSAFATSLSSVKVKVEATKFGQEYNIPSSSNFTVGDASTTSYFAKNDSAFSGGTKKSIQVVSKKDLDTLASSISDSVKEKAVQSASSKVGSDEGIFSSPLSVSFKDKTFNKKEGEEAKQVGLSATITFSMGVYKKTELEDYARELAKSEIPSDYTLSSGDSHIDLNDIKLGKDQQVSAKLAISQVYIPSLDTKSLTAKSAGKSVGSVEKEIRGMNGVTNVHVVITRKIPILSSFLPFNSKNIEVTIAN